MKSIRGWPKNDPSFRGRPKNLEWKEQEYIRGFCAQLRTGRIAKTTQRIYAQGLRI